MVKIGILKEYEADNRVACTPETVASLKKMNVEVLVEHSAGVRSSHYDEEYAAQGAMLRSRDEVLSQSDLLLSINIPSSADQDKAAKTAWLGAFMAMNHPVEIESWAQKGSLIFTLDMLPRTTRAQAMDVLSSQANIAGYKAVLLAAGMYPRYFPMLMTAAGSIAPAKVLILGAGVAGLQAIATARRLGAVVYAFDTRPVVKEQVMSLGGKFVEVEGAADASSAGGYAVEQSDDFKKRQKGKIAEFVAKSDIIITTAQLRGRKAPILITKEMVDSMRPGSIIVDLASSTGGNVESTKDGEMVMENGVVIIGNSNLPSDMPADASKLLGKNMLQFIKLLIDKEGNFKPDFEDELVINACVGKDGNVTSEALKSLLVKE